MISEFLKDGEILKKINSLKKSTDFERIIKNNRSYDSEITLLGKLYNTDYNIKVLTIDKNHKIKVWDDLNEFGIIKE